MVIEIVVVVVVQGWLRESVVRAYVHVDEADAAEGHVDVASGVGEG